MTGSTRIHGAALALKFGGTDYWADATSVVLDNEDAPAGVVTFYDASVGGARRDFFTVSAIQSTAAGSFWRYVWANPGSEVAFIYAPHGNAVATSDEPHLTGTCKIGPRPKLGGDAGIDVDQVFEVRFDVIGTPTLDTGASDIATISAITPEGQTVGEMVVLSGTRFTGATAVRFGASSATFIFVSDSTLTAVIAGATGSVNVTVVTADGTSDALAYTVAAS